MAKKLNKSEIGKKSRKDGQKFELSVRKDLEKMGWIVCKWSNNVDLLKSELIAAKHKFNFFTKVMSMGTGFPDFIAYEKDEGGYRIMGVESKSNGYLDKEEKEKVNWLKEHNIFGKILVASKGNKRGEIIYKDV
jgi:hypothetical protein